MMSEGATLRMYITIWSMYLLNFIRALLRVLSFEAASTASLSFTLKEHVELRIDLRCYSNSFFETLPFL